MAAYKVEILKRTCRVCSNRATHEVFNTYNASVGYFCRGHADKKVEELNNQGGDLAH